MEDPDLTGNVKMHNLLAAPMVTEIMAMKSQPNGEDADCLVLLESVTAAVVYMLADKNKIMARAYADVVAEMVLERIEEIAR